MGSLHCDRDAHPPATKNKWSPKSPRGEHTYVEPDGESQAFPRCESVPALPQAFRMWPSHENKKRPPNRPTQSGKSKREGWTFPLTKEVSHIVSQSVSEVAEPRKNVAPLVQAIVDSAGDDRHLWELRSYRSETLNGVVCFESSSTFFSSRYSLL